MDVALSLAGFGTLDVDVKKVLTFVGMSSKKRTALSGDVIEVAKSISSVVDSLLLEVIQQRTAENFGAARHRVFPVYLVAMKALSSLAENLVPDSVLKSIVYESFSELEAEIREQGLNKFGAAVRDQAMFTVWTMRKINDLVAEICKAEALPTDKKADAQYAGKFGLSTAWAQFHMDCLFHSIRVGQPIFPEVLGEVQDGLRSIVNAYAWIRQCADLRISPSEPVLQSPEWDDEDEELLASSSRDMEADLQCSNGD